MNHQFWKAGDTYLRWNTWKCTDQVPYHSYCGNTFWGLKVWEIFSIATHCAQKKNVRHEALIVQFTPKINGDWMWKGCAQPWCNEGFKFGITWFTQNRPIPGDLVHPQRNPCAWLDWLMRITLSDQKKTAKDHGNPIRFWLFLLWLWWWWWWLWLLWLWLWLWLLLLLLLLLLLMLLMLMLLLLMLMLMLLLLLLLLLLQLAKVEESEHRYKLCGYGLCKGVYPPPKIAEYKVQYLHFRYLKILVIHAFWGCFLSFQKERIVLKTIRPITSWQNLGCWNITTYYYYYY